MTVATSSLRYDNAEPARAPIMVVGDTPAARHRARTTAELSGLRTLSELSPAEAVEALEERATLSALWIELDDEPTLPVRRLLDRAGRESARKSFGVVVATRLEQVDEVLAQLADADVELLVSADEMERFSSLSLAVQPQHIGAARDVASDASAARLRQLSEEVSRIASTLARLSTASAGPPLSPATMAPPRSDVPNVSAEALRSMIRARRLRSTFLPADLFADPAWDMLLDLLQAEIVQHRVPVSSLCIAAAVPATTALRWIKSMTDRGLLVRRDDPHDGRRVFIEMAPATSAGLRRYFQEVGMAAV
ncbi:DNA-binding MarR family transcriptional regulator/CheY-like chemotaxis protein [Sphingomonas kaistensis]|uniref:DNA-binding MarR family transcriptional regulator/CheY-like chemotaxis protein n=1 Tax=Sphingomonas kaistensis TaxID=298708 RepID=A0A7X5Y877_9SPHN|nr:winged helix DNA-binding protein [Sphingomonas kaistensis]NJC06949.1 DNA-binding MarR family transcriptional regulator/CheY-like chemotaxis protein [Sphingomonas kaistensis]